MKMGWFNSYFHVAAVLKVSLNENHTISLVVSLVRVARPKATRTIGSKFLNRTKMHRLEK